jgi:hypothetical protein
VEARTLVEIARVVLEEKGSFWLRITGSSMSPLLRESDSVLLIGGETAQVGDVVFVDAGGLPILHRLVACADHVIQTKGDACAAVDPDVPTGAVLARAILARRGDTLIALIPTARFGLRPFARYLFWLVYRQLRELRRTLGPYARGR